MRFSITVTCLLALANWASAGVINVKKIALPELEKRGPLAMGAPLELHPKRRPGHHLKKRDELLEGLDPRDEDSFLYGDPDEGEQHFMAEVTLVMEDGRKLVSMERFEGLTKSVTCGEKMTLEFVDQKSFEYAIEAWGWVNEDADGQFVMIANHEGCGELATRVPYDVIDVDYDEEKFIAYLYGKQMEWTDIKGEMTVDFGAQVEDDAIIPDDPNAPPPPFEGLEKRGLEKRFGITKDAFASFNMANSLGASHTIWGSSVRNLDLSLDCLNCGTSGYFDISGRIKIGFPASLKELSIQAKPRNFKARLELEVTAEGTVKGFSDEKQLLSIAPPGSISIKKIFKLGASLDYDIGMSATVSGHATMSYGLIGKLSNNAVVKVDVKNPGNSKFSGWAPTFEKIPFKADADVDGTIAVYGKPSLSLGFNIIEKWGYEAELGMKLPEITTTLRAKTSSAGGLCGVKKNKAAVEAAASVGVDLGFRVGEENGGKTFYSKSLYAKKYNIFNKCIGFHGSGSGSGTGSGSTPKKPKKPKKTTEAPKKAPPKPTQTPKKATPKKKPASRKAEEDKKKPKPTHSTKKPVKKTTRKTISSKVSLPTTKPEANKTSKKDDDDKKSSTKKNDKDDSSSSKKAPSPASSKPSPASATKTSSVKVSKTSASGSPTKSKTSSSPIKPTSSKSRPSSLSSSSRNDSSNTAPSKTSSISSSTTSSFDSCGTTPPKKASALPKPVLAQLFNRALFGRQVSAAPPQPSGSACPILKKDHECNGDWSTVTYTKNTAKSSKEGIEFKCNTTTWKILYYDYPGPHKTYKIGEDAGAKDRYFFDYKSNDCTSWDLEQRKTARKGAAYQTEHVYEAQMVRDYLKFLVDEKQFKCDQIGQLFFSPWAFPSDNTKQSDMDALRNIKKVDANFEKTGAYMLSKQIGNNVIAATYDRMSLLPGDMNREKAILLALNNVDVDTLFKDKSPGSAPARVTKILSRLRAVVGAWKYLELNSPRKMMKKTIDGINDQLNSIEKDPKFNPGKVDYKLSQRHDEYIEWLYGKVNTQVQETAEKFAAAFKNARYKELWDELSKKEQDYVDDIAKKIKKVGVVKIPVAADL